MTLIDPEAPELLSCAKVAHLCSVDRATIRRWVKDYTMPAPLLIGEKVHRWRRAELVDWIRAGCPRRDLWERMGWRPSMPVKLDALIALKHAEIREQTETLRELLALKERGDTLLNVRG